MMKYFHLRRKLPKVTKVKVKLPSARIPVRRSSIFSMFDRACTSILLIKVRWLAFIKCALPRCKPSYQVL